MAHTPNENLLTGLNAYLNNGGLSEVNKLTFDAIFKYGELFNTCRPLTGVRNGDKAGYLGKMSDVGWAGSSCKPTYKDPTLGARGKAWELGDYEIPLQFCYKDLQNTIARYCLKTGTDAADLQGTEFMSKIFLPMLDEAVARAYWRMAWFGNKKADNTDGSGSETDKEITSGVDASLFTMADGFWKRITEHTGVNASGAGQHFNMAPGGTAIDITANGKALEVVEGVLEKANSLIKDGVLFLTKSLSDALKKDYRREYKNTIPFMEVADGVKLPSYDGHPIVTLAEWDNMIKEYQRTETTSSGTTTITYNMPHRALFANPDNFLVGTTDKSVFADFNVWFDIKDRMNYVYLSSNIGTMIVDDTLYSVAY